VIVCVKRMTGPDADAAMLTYHFQISTGRQVCPRCQQWERESASRSYASVRSHSCASLRGVGATARIVFKSSDPSHMLPIFAQATRSSLRAGRLPAVLPFHSRLFRRAHHSTKNARRWAVLNLSKPYIRAHHPRCELCGPSVPCILPCWAFVGLPRSASPAVSESRDPAPPAHEDDFRAARNPDRISHASGASSQSSGFAEADREGTAAPTRSALHHALSSSSWHPDRPTAFTGIDKDVTGRYFRPPHICIDAVSATAHAHTKPALTQCSLRRSIMETFGTESWHVVDGASSASVDAPVSVVRPSARLSWRQLPLLSYPLDSAHAGALRAHAGLPLRSLVLH
jgi:hypothetical protein